MNNNSNFFKTVFSICSGTEVFTQLLRTSCRKAIFYLLLLSFLCSLLAVALQSFQRQKTISKYCNAIYAQFGEARFTDHGLVPSLKPEEARFMRIEDNRIDYVPDKAGETVFNPDDGVSSKGILWLPTSVVLWMKANSDFYVFPLFFSLSKIPDREKISDNPKDKIIAYAEKNSFEPVKYKDETPLNFSKMHLSLLLVMLTLIFINIFLTILLFIPMSAIFFSLVFFMTGKGEMPDEVTFSSLFTITLYSSFPGIIIASIYYGLNLPFIDFQTVCLICFLIYLMAVLNRIKRMNKPEPEENDGGYDDDDF